MTRVEQGGLRLLVFDSLENAGITACVSPRPLDVREADGRRRFVAAAGLDPDALVSPRQVHKSDIIRAAAARRGDPPEADGVVTNVPGLPLLLRAADCSLVVVADPERRALGLAHAGWKGSARGVVVNLVKALHENYGSRPSQLVAAIGPTISQANYPVGGEVPAAFLKSRDWTKEHVRAEGGKLYFDLAEANAHFLRECGIPAKSIEVCGYCTYEESDLLHSYRRDGAAGGHHGLVAALE